MQPRENAGIVFSEELGLAIEPLRGNTTLAELWRVV